MLQAEIFMAQGGVRSWRERWESWQETLEVRFRERVTTSGFVFLVAITLVGLAAFASANNLLFLLLSAMLATILVSGFLNRLVLSGLELDVRLPDHVAARRQAEARLSLRNTKRWMPSFSISLAGAKQSAFATPIYFPLVPAGGQAEASINVEFARRGLHTEDSFVFSSRFPFGFALRRVAVTMKHDLLIYPCIEEQPGFGALLNAVGGEVAMNAQGRGNDFYRIRPYQALESARHVDWKATAHTGDLQVREFAREQDPEIALFLDHNVGPAHLDWLERAVECCAYLTWELAQRGARVRIRSHSFSVVIPVEGDAYTILKFLALVEPRQGPVPAPLLHEAIVEIAFTPRPEAFSAAGWNGSGLLVLGPGDAVFGRPEQQPVPT